MVAEARLKSKNLYKVEREAQEGNFPLRVLQK
jgi:hypothetical protein